MTILNFNEVEEDPHRDVLDFVCLHPDLSQNGKYLLLNLYHKWVDSGEKAFKLDLAEQAPCIGRYQQRTQQKYMREVEGFITLLKTAEGEYCSVLPLNAPSTRDQWQEDINNS
ncbi:MAG: hypothetical protein HN929_01990 [Chloroflexi bacterium]|jgi:hypothetical protein|nr:hypothetical protein [Chloroflexota bacterium]